MDFRIGDTMPDDYQPDFAEEPAAAPAPEPAAPQQEAAVEPAPAPEPEQAAAPTPEFKIGDTMPDNYQPDFAGEPAAPAAPAAATGKKPWGASSAFYRGLVSSGVTGNLQGLSQTSELLNTVAGADKNSGVGQFAEAVAGIADKTNKWGYQEEVPSISDVTSPGKAWTYIKEKAGEAVGSTGPSIAGGLIGGAVGGMVGGAAGVPEAGVGEVVTAPLGAVVGAYTGAAIPSFFANAGPTWDDLRNDEGVKAAVASGHLTDQQVAYYGLAAGSVVAALDAGGVGEIMKAAGITKEAAKPIIEEAVKKTMLGAIAHGAVAEGFTEALQETISQSTQALLGGNADLVKRATSVIDNAVGGILGGGLFAGTGHMLPKTEGQKGEPAPPENASPEAASPEVAPPDANTPAGQTGSGTVHPPPAGAEPQHTAEAPPSVTPAPEPAEVDPAAAKTTEPEVVEDVPADIAATQQEPTQPQEEDEDNLDVDPSLSPEEQQQARQDQEQARAARTGVDPSVAAATAATQPAATSAPTTVDEIVAKVQQAGAEATAAKQQQDAAKAAQQQQEAAARVPPPPAVGPVVETPTAEPVAQEQVQEPAAIPETPPVTAAEDVVTPPVAGAEQQAETPPVAAQPEAVQTPEDKQLADAVAALHAIGVAPEPAVQPEAAADVTPEAPIAAAVKAEAAARPKLSQVGRMMADEIRTRLGNTKLSEHPHFMETIEKVAHGTTKALGAGIAPAKEVRDRAEAATAEVRRQLNEATEEQHRQTVAQHVAAVAEARRIAEEAKVKAATPQTKARVSRVTGEKPAGAIATEKPENTRKRIEKKDEAERTEAEKEWLGLYQKKARIKGGGEKNAKARVPLQSRMDEIRGEWVKGQQARDVEKNKAEEELARVRAENAEAVRAEEERPGEKTAEEVAREGREKIAREEAERTAKEAVAKGKAEIAARERKQKGRAIAKDALDATPLDYTKDASKGAIEALVARIKSAFKSAGLDFPEKVSRASYSAEENLAIFADRALHGKEGPVGIHYIALAKHQLDQNDVASMYDLLHLKSSTEGVSYDDALHGPELSEDEQTEAAIRADEKQAKRAARITEELPDTKASKLPTDKQGNASYSWIDENGKKQTIKTRLHFSGSEAVDWISQFHPPGRGVMGFIRKMHMRRLREMVPRVPVLFVTGDEINRAGGITSSPRGAYLHSNIDGMAQGQKGIVLINRESAERRSKADLAHVIEHELSHAATVYAIDTDFRGTRQIVRKMMDALDEQLRAQGIDTSKINGLADEKEFVADAYSDPKFQQMLKDNNMPDDLVKKLGLPSDRQPSWWDAVIAMVRNAMNLERMGAPGRSYIEGMMTLHPDLMMPEKEQMHRAREDWLLGGDGDPTSEGYGERLTRAGDRQVSFLPDMSDVDNNLQAGLYKRVWGRAKEFGRYAWRKFATSEDLKRRVAGYFNNNSDNVFSDMVDNMMKSGEEAHRQSQTGVLTAHKFLKFRNANPKEAGAISRLFFRGSQAGYHPAYALSHPTNSHISKKGINHTQLRALHAKDHAEFNRLSAEGKNVFHELDDHWRKMYNDKNHAIVSSYVEQAIDSGKIAVPQGITRSEVEDFIFNGGIDKPDALLSPNEKVIKQGMGKSYDDLQKMTELRKIKGVYAPFLRHGNKFFTARKDVDLPPGAVRGPEHANAQELIFKNKADYKNYLATTEDVISHRFTRATDPTTGLNRDPATGKAYRLIDDPNFQPYYHARVLNRSMRMDNNEANLEHQRQQYIKKGYTVSGISELDKEMHSDNDMMPQHVRRLVRGIERGKGSEATKKSAIGGILDAYYRQMAGSVSQQRMLKRGGDEGYSKDLLNTLIKTNSADSQQLAALHWRGKFAEDDAKLDDEITRRAKLGDPNTLKLQSAVKEVRSRRDVYHDQSTTFSRISQAIRSMSYIKNLGGVMFSIMNAVQPLGTTLPVLAGRHGDMRALGNLMNAYWRMGGGRTMLRGVAETGKQGLHYLKSIAPILYGKDVMPREGSVNYHTRLVDYIKRNRNTIPNADAYLAGMQELADRGWGADSGLEMEDLSDLGKTKPERLLYGFTRIFQELPKSIEANNRYGTMMAAIDGEIQTARREAAKAGVAPDMAAINDRAVRYATTTVERTQGGYNQKNNPNFITSPIGKLAFQYKPYGLMSGQLFWGQLLNSFKGNSPEVRREARRTVVRMAAMATVMAGAYGLPLMEIGRTGWLIAEMMGAVDGGWDDAEARMQEWLAKIFGGRATEDVLHGLSREVNIDLSKRLGMDSMVTFGEPKTLKPEDVESWIISSFAGAPASMVVDAYKAYQTGDWTKYPVPRIAKDIGQAWTGANVGTKSKSGATTYDKPSGWNAQRILQAALGVPSADDARKYEAGGSALKYKQKKAASDERQKTEQRWLNASTPAEKAKIWTDIRSNYNPDKKGKEKITYTDLLNAQKRRVSSARSKAKADKEASP